MIFPFPSSPHWAPNTLSEDILRMRGLGFFYRRPPRRMRSKSEVRLSYSAHARASIDPSFGAQLRLPKPPPPGVSTSMTAPRPRLSEA